MNFWVSALLKSMLILISLVVGLYFSESKLKKYWVISIIGLVVLLSVACLDFYESKEAREPLRPFVNAAIKTYPGIPENQALDLVLEDIINREKIVYIGEMIVVDSSNLLVHVIHQFRSGNPCGTSNVKIEFQHDLTCNIVAKLTGRAFTEDNGKFSTPKDGQVIYTNQFLPGGVVLKISFSAIDTVITKLITMGP